MLPTCCRGCLNQREREGDVKPEVRDERRMGPSFMQHIAHGKSNNQHDTLTYGKFHMIFDCFYRGSSNSHRGAYFGGCWVVHVKLSSFCMSLVWEGRMDHEWVK